MEMQNVVPESDINYQLQRILGSPAFRNSPTLSNFLSFIISETLAERGLQIKEYSIAINALNRSRNFNPQDDAVVRIHAGRLRRALNEYYLIEGINDPIIIEIPKGGYVPQFKEGNAPKPVTQIPSVFSEQVINPILAVFPFRIMPEKQEVKTFSLILTEQLSAELSRFQDISVIGYFTSEILEKIEQNIIEAGRSIGADYVISGSVQYNNHQLRILINLLVTSTGEVMLVKSFEREGLVSDMFDMQDEIMQTVVAAVGGYHGIIFQEMSKRFPGKVFNNPGVREAIYIYRQYKRAFSQAKFNSALSELQQVVKENPNHSVCWAMLGELYLDGMVLGIMNDVDALELAYQHVLRSFKIDPLCQHAWYVLTGIHLFRKEKEACLSAAHQCIQLNPHSGDMVIGVAFMLICAGYYEKGFGILEKSIKSASYEPLWMSIGGCLYYLHKKEYANALFWAEKMNAEESVWDPLLKCISLSYFNKKDQAHKYLAKLLIIEAQTPGKIKGMLSSLLLSDELLKDTLRGLTRLGFQEEMLTRATVQERSSK